MDKFFVEGGKPADKPFRSLPMWTLEPPQTLVEATVLGNYCEVWLAKHDDDGNPTGGIVGINRLTKVALPTLASLYGAMLAGVDYVIMGAGIPLRIPGVLDNLADGQDAAFPVDVHGSEENMEITFSPKSFWNGAEPPVLARPKFIPIVSSVVLAQSFLKRADGKGPTKGVDGFVVELPTAGGHNAPPRGFRYDPVSKSHAVDLNERGEPIYGEKDEVDLEKFRKAVKGLPFWLAGSYARAEKLEEILQMGGAGVQVGTVFALAKESGMESKIKQQILRTILEKDMSVFTDPVASPTGYPFKVLEIPETLSEEAVYMERPRVCSLGYLRTAYLDKESGKVGYRCPAEPVNDWLKKGGEIEATKGRKCLCNALCANVGLPQTRFVTQEDGTRVTYVEQQLITIGDEVNFCRRFIKEEEDGSLGYSAGDVIDYLKSTWDEHQARREVKDALAHEATEVSASTPNFQI